MNKNGGPAFPEHGGIEGDDPRNHTLGGGMSMRDWFAGQALAGMTTRQSFHAIEDVAAMQAYAMADAMIAERSK